jgi:hypothetical protein
MARRALAYTVAERAVAIGFVPDGQAQAVTAGSQLAPVARAALEDRVAVRELTHRIAEVSERARTRMNHLGELDAASQDVLIDVVRALEEQQWILRAQLHTRMTASHGSPPEWASRSPAAIICSVCLGGIPVPGPAFRAGPRPRPAGTDRPCFPDRRGR